MKILSNKKYNELILKSCKGMFGAVTDDMLLRDNALLNEENKQLKEKLNTYENPDDMTLMFMWCDEKAKDKIKELTQALLDIKEYIKEKRKSGEIFYINEVEKMVNKALGDK